MTVFGRNRSRSPFGAFVRRHTNLAVMRRVFGSANTLIRQGMGDQGHSGQQSGKDTPLVVKAYLPRNPGEIELGDFNESRVEDLHMSIKPLKRRPSSHTHAPSPVSSSLPAGSTNASRQGEVLDTDWNRLRTIQRLHQQRQQAESIAEEPGSSPAILKEDDSIDNPDTSPDTVKIHLKHKDLDLSPTARDPILRQEEPVHPVQAASTRKNVDQSAILQSVQSPASKEKDSIAEEVDFPGDDSLRVSDPNTVMPLDMNNSDTVRRANVRYANLPPDHKPDERATVFTQDISHKEQETSSVDIQAGPKAFSNNIDANRLDDTLEDTGDQSSLDQHAVPLQSAWPVQRVASNRPDTVPPSSKQVKPEAIIGTSALEPESDLDEFTRPEMLLRAVEPGAPTKSSIELIPLRKRRPKSNLPEDVSDVAERIVANKKIVQDSQAIDNDSVGLIPGNSTLIPKSDVKFAVEINKESVGSSVDTQPVQKDFNETPAGETVQPNKTTDETVATEIGPLPADLWELIGAVPSAGDHEPKNAKTHPLQSVQRKITHPGQPWTQTPDYPIVEHTRAQQLAVVQRDVDQSTQTGRPGNVSGAERTTPDEDHTSETEIDIHELARKVYEEVKRKLTIDRERQRRF